jgi:hypothetical protein
LLFWGWLGGYGYEGGEVKCGKLLTIEDLGEILHSMYSLSHEVYSTDTAQSLSTSKTAMSFIFRSKSICSRSSRLWKSWYVMRLVTYSMDSLTHLADTSCTQRSHARRLRAPATYQSICQGLACWLPDAEPQERQLAPP